MSLHRKLKIVLDSISDLPYKIYEIIFLDLVPETLLNCRRVSKSWTRIADNDDGETDSLYEWVIQGTLSFRTKLEK